MGIVQGARRKEERRGETRERERGRERGSSFHSIPFVPSFFNFAFCHFFRRKEEQRSWSFALDEEVIKSVSHSRGPLYFCFRIFFFRRLNGGQTHAGRDGFPWK